MSRNWSRRGILSASGALTLGALSGCSSLRGDSTPLTVRLANPSDRTYRVELEIFKSDATALTEAQILDESYTVEPTDGFTRLTQIKNQPYHVRARFNGQGLTSPQYQYEYYTSCGSSENLTPTLSVTLHPESEHDSRFITFSQTECP
jgi:hypothetical protein